jgi:hypothetical protein
MRVRFILASLAVALVPMASSLAQTVTAPLKFNQLGGGEQAKPGPPKGALPPGLPGAASNNAPAPSNRAPTDMEPNEALFDAINRGDIGAARDAINRGADLHAHNILGMTPLELSVDLGRNNISFMLLSMRGDDERPRPPAGLAAGKAPPTKHARQVPAHAPARVTASASPATQTAHLFSGDGGSPNPNAGFLGFGSR